MAKPGSLPKKTPISETRKWITEDDITLICEAWEEYQGPLDAFEAATGALILGRLGGYNALRVGHSWRTLRKYEDILGIKFADTLPEETLESDRVNGIRYAKKFKAFWKALGAGVATEDGAKDVVPRAAVKPAHG